MPGFRTFTKDSNDETFGLPEFKGTWSPKAIVYRRISLRLKTIKKGPPPFRELRIEFLKDPDYTKDVDVKKFVRKKATGQTFLANTNDKDRKFKRSLLDLKVNRACYVVLELSPEVDWWFTPGREGLTTELENENNDQYFDLVHIKPDGTPYKKGEERDNCRMIYFSIVKVRPKKDDDDLNSDAFNLYVRLKNRDDHFTDIIIDPDIKNEGPKQPRPGPKR